MNLLTAQLTAAQQATKPTNQLGDLIGAIGQLREVSDLIGGGGEGKDTTAGMIEMLSGILANKAKEPAPGRPAPPRQAPPRPAPPRQLAPPPAPPRQLAPTPAPQPNPGAPPEQEPGAEDLAQPDRTQTVLAAVEPVEDDEPESMEDEVLTAESLAEDLAQLPPREVAQTIANYLKLADPEAAKEALSALMAAL